MYEMKHFFPSLPIVTSPTDRSSPASYPSQPTIQAHMGQVKIPADMSSASNG